VTTDPAHTLDTPAEEAASPVFEAEFDKYADEYRRIHAQNIRITGEMPEYFAEYKISDAASLVARAGFPADLKILDFGAGVGTSTPYFRKYFPDGQITCLDVSSQSLDIGRERFGSFAEFVHFNGAEIPFPDGHFELAFLACVLHHIPHEQHPDVMKELYRVLRPGGLLVIFEHNPYNPLTVRAVNTCLFDENAVLVKPARLKANAASAGFSRPEIKFRVFFPHVLRALRSLEPALARVPLGGQYSLHARKHGVR
jgi:SAM-dependent methyltransferase